MKLRSLVLFPFIIFCIGLNAQQAFVPTEPISLLDEPSFAFLLTPEHSLTDKHEEAWSFGYNQLHVTGKGWGSLLTHKAYRDYHLVFEYKWGEHTYGERADQARSSGLLIHGQAPQTPADPNNIGGVEILLAEGASGYFGKNDKPVGWKDKRGFRKTNDIENPVGGWNRLEVICQGEKISTLLNGQPVQQHLDTGKRDGHISLQSLNAELWVRRWELWPLGSFTETWTPDVPSTNTGISETGESILPREFPWSPEQSQAAWQIDGDYEMELVAAEPVVRDPVDVVWDEKGQMFVAEMGDYPLPTETGPLMSRIRLLSDEDSDGRMDKATTWADHLDHVQGMLPMNGGLLITTRAAIMFLKDNDGDGVADEKRSLFTSNEPRHNQLQVSSPRWGLDNRVYLNNGLEGTEIYPSGTPSESMQFRGRDLRYDPRKNEIGVTTGRGQFGGSLDDWGRRFFSTNRNPIIHAVMPVEALERNPASGITLGYEDIQAQASPIYPIHISHTTSSAHLGTHTAACGLGVYRGHLMPELLGNIFVCDPTGQLVTRNRLVPNGASFVAERVGDRRDFLASSDEWTRPVQIRNGPDGALYVCDMYRRFIDHAKFFPEDFKETNFLRAGLDHGRIWRLVPKGVSSPGIKPLPTKNSDLVRLLESKISWERIHAQRLLIKRDAKDVVPKIEDLFEHSSSAHGRLHALWTLHGLYALSKEQIAAALNDPEPGLVENAIRLADPIVHSSRLLKLAGARSSRVSFLAMLALGATEANQSTFSKASLKSLMNGGLSDPWMRKAILSASNPPTAELVVAILEAMDGRSSFAGGSSNELADFLREFSAEIGARGDMEGIRQIAAQVVTGKTSATDAPIVEGLSQGLKRSSLRSRSMSALLNEPPAPLTQNDLSGIRATIDSAATVAMDRSLPTEERLGALSLVQEMGKETVFEVARKLIVQTEPPEIQSLACRLLSRLNRKEVAQFYFDEWKSLGPIPRRAALEMMSSNDETALELMKRMQKGEINPAVMPAFQRWRMHRRENKEVVALAYELFGAIDQDRAKIIADYSSGLEKEEGDPQQGRAVFEKAACSTCHRIGDLGVDVGPTLADVRFKLTDALLSDILDPNRAVEERWALYTAETKDGQSFSGLIASETSTTLEIKVAGGHSEIISRNQLVNLETSGLSLMPVGLEGVISKSEMSDLIAFLTNR